jgi:hypothetical protein
MVWKTNVHKKRKSLPNAGGLENCRASLLLLAVGPPLSLNFPRSLSRPRGPAQEPQPRAPSLLCFADERDP